MASYDPESDLDLLEYCRRQPGRCRVCGFHTATQGHREGCAAAGAGGHAAADARRGRGAR